MSEHDSSKPEKSLARILLDFYRVAPLGESLALLGIAASINNGENNSTITLLSVIVGACGSALAGMQFQAKARLENAVRDNVFREKAYLGFTQEWCARQTALVVARDHGHTQEFKALIKRQRDKGEVELGFIPNF